LVRIPQREFSAAQDCPDIAIEGPLVECRRGDVDIKGVAGSASPIVPRAVREDRTHGIERRLERFPSEDYRRVEHGEDDAE
jgi:hypothetical protein